MQSTAQHIARILELGEEVEQLNSRINILETDVDELSAARDEEEMSSELGARLEWMRKSYETAKLRCSYLEAQLKQEKSKSWWKRLIIG